MIANMERDSARNKGATLAHQIEHGNDFLVSTFQAYISLFARWLRVSSLHFFYPVLATTNVEDHPSLQQFIDTSGDWPKDVVFSIRPPHAENILAGTKTVELRRRFSRTVKVGTRALIYSTTPTRALTGSAQISGVHWLSIADIWDQYGNAACVSKSDFDAYFSGVDCGYAIVLSDPEPLSRPIGLDELREQFGFEPPQSYQYVPPELRFLIRHEWPQDLN